MQRAVSSHLEVGQLSQMIKILGVKARGKATVQNLGRENISIFILGYALIYMRPLYRTLAA